MSPRARPAPGDAGPPPAVLDRRGWPVRLLARLWEAPRVPAWARAADRLGAPCRRAVMARRAAGRAQPPPAPLIVSIGNLVVGGAGKTPVVLALAEALSRQGHAGAVVTRGYPSRARGPQLVSPHDAAAGDEARLLAASLPPAWRVFQAADRLAGLRAALATAPAPAVVLLEDAHQSARVPRHLDVLLLDRWQREGPAVRPVAGPTLPWGPYREGPEGAARAAIWLLELDPGDGGGWLAHAEAWPAAAPNRSGGRPGPAPRLLGFRRRAVLPAELDAAGAAARGLAGGGVGQGSPGADVPYGTVCGVARPRAFTAACAALLGRPPHLAVWADDHAGYAPREVARLLAEGRRRGVAMWLTTAKDAVKLRPLWPASPPLHVVGLTVEWPGKDALPDVVGERVRKSPR